MIALRRIRWTAVTLIVMGIVAAGLGYVGLREHCASTGQQKSALDIAYLTIQLFFLESGAVDGSIGLKLQIARFLAPLTTAYAVLQAIASLFTVQLQLGWLWFRGGHVVICGLGRKGARLVEQLRKDRWRVVVIEHDPDNDDLAYCRAQGAVTLIGAANEEWTLRRSYVHRANSVIVVTGDDGANIETAVHTHRLNARRASTRKPLRCIVHVREPRLRNLIQDHRLYHDSQDQFELELFNVLEVAARSMLREPPVLLRLGSDAAWPPRLLVVGMGRLGEALLRRVLKDWHIDYPATEDRLRVTVVDARAAECESQFRLRYPHLGTNADLRFVALDVHSAEFARGAFMDESPTAAAPTAAYVCIDNDSLAMSAALTLQRLFEGDLCPIVVRMSQETGLASLLSTDSDRSGAIGGIRAVGLLDLTCKSEVVLGGAEEILAQSIHQAYLYDQLADGKAFGSTESLVSWEELDEGLKMSNRDQAGHVKQKLVLIHCEIFPSNEDDVPRIEFTAEEIERLAADEHIRWVGERKAAGWKLGAEKNLAKKTSPYLVSWEELPEDVRDIDRNMVRRLPANLAKADYEIRRLSASS